MIKSSELVGSDLCFFKNHLFQTFLVRMIYTLRFFDIALNFRNENFSVDFFSAPLFTLCIVYEVHRYYIELKSRIRYTIIHICRFFWESFMEGRHKKNQRTCPLTEVGFGLPLYSYKKQMQNILKRKNNYSIEYFCITKFVNTFI